MKVVQINTANFGSTGNIMLGIGRLLEAQGDTTYYCVAKSRSNLKKSVNNRLFTGTILDRNLHLLLSYTTGFNGCFSYFHTLRLIRKLKEIHPDVIHLHNLHNGFINLPVLFRYIKETNVPVVWTLHDCWAFTGQCPHFTMAKCEKWKTGCHDCTSYREYPASRVDRTKTMWELKNKWFTGVDNLTIVTPSKWLADLVIQSFLKEYPVRIINNGVDLSVFKPTASNFRDRYGIKENEIMLLGVAFDWSEKKGLDVFLELSKRLDSSKYRIVLVGTNDATDKQLNSNIISIHRTQNQQELAEIYTAADLFVNPTREEVLGLVNIEANACGTPVITFRTGGSPECINDFSGVVVECDDIDAMEREIIFISQKRPFEAKACMDRAKQFDKEKRFVEYLELYRTLSLRKWSGSDDNCGG